MDEYSRLLSNPDNFIISEELRGRIDGAPENNEVLAKLFLEDREHECKLVFYSRTTESIRLTLDVGNLDFAELMKAKFVGCEICDEYFEFGRNFDFDNSASSSILILSKASEEKDNESRVL